MRRSGALLPIGLAVLPMLLAILLLCSGSASAADGPGWMIRSLAQPTNFPRQAMRRAGQAGNARPATAIR